MISGRPSITQEKKKYAKQRHIHKELVSFSSKESNHKHKYTNIKLKQCGRNFKVKIIN